MPRKPQQPKEPPQVQDSNSPEVLPQVSPVVTESEQSEVQPVIETNASHKPVSTDQLPHGATIENF